MLKPKVKVGSEYVIKGQNKDQVSACNYAGGNQSDWKMAKYHTMWNTKINESNHYTGEILMEYVVLYL